MARKRKYARATRLKGQFSEQPSIFSEKIATYDTQPSMFRKKDKAWDSQPTMYP